MGQLAGLETNPTEVPNKPKRGVPKFRTVSLLARDAGGLKFNLYNTAKDENVRDAWVLRMRQVQAMCALVAGYARVPVKQVWAGTDTLQPSDQKAASRSAWLWLSAVTPALHAGAVAAWNAWYLILDDRGLLPRLDKHPDRVVDPRHGAWRAAHAMGIASQWLGNRVRNPHAWPRRQESHLANTLASQALRQIERLTRE